MKEKQMKNQELKEQGVTLVALVVTIIIMLILSAVVLRFTVGDNGILRTSEQATEKYENAQKGEEDYLNTAADDIKNMRETSKRIKAEELNAEAKKYYGSYVTYSIDLDGDGEYTSDWKLFYAGGEDDAEEVKGRIYIIAADYVPMNNTILQTAMDLAGMKPVTKTDYEKLSANWPNELTYQELKEETIKLFMHEEYDLLTKSSIINSVCSSTLLNTENWQGFAKGRYGNLAIGGPTVEMWCKAWNQVVDATDTTNNLKKMYANGDNTSGYGYYWGTEKDTKNYNSIYMNGTSSPLNNLTKLVENYSVFFKQTSNTNVTANGVIGNCYGYFLSSPSAYLTDKMLFVRYDGLVGISSCGSTNGVRLTSIGMLRRRCKIEKEHNKINRKTNSI